MISVKYFSRVPYSSVLEALHSKNIPVLLQETIEFKTFDSVYLFDKSIPREELSLIKQILKDYPYKFYLFSENEDLKEIHFLNKLYLEDIKTLITNIQMSSLDAEPITQDSLRQIILGSYLDYIFHDINNPLGSLSMSVQLIDEMVRDEKEEWNEKLIRNFSTSMVDSLDKTVSLMRSYMKHSSISGEDRELLNLREICHHIQIVLFPVSRKKKISIDVERVETVGMGIDADISMLILMVYHALLEQLEEKSVITVRTEDYRIHIHFQKKIENFVRLFGECPLPPYYYAYSCKKIISRNDLNFEFNESSIVITFLSV